MKMEAGMPRKTAEEIRTAEQQETRYEGIRNPTPEEIKILEQAKDVVCAYLQSAGLTENMEKVKAMQPEKVRIYDEKFILHEGEWRERNVQGEHASDDIQEFPRKTVESPVFLHVAVHELFHHAAGGKDAFVEVEDGNYIRKASGVALYPTGRSERGMESKARFSGLNEAITETLARYALPEDAVLAHDSYYSKYRFLLQILLRKIVADKSKSDPSFGVKEAWNIFQEDYFSGTHKFLSEIQRLYGKDMPKKLANFGKARDVDLNLVKEIYPSPWEGFGMDVVNMVWGEDSRATQEFYKLDKELRAVVAPSNGQKLKS